MGLPPQYKLLWLYLIDECDNAGIWDCNFALAKFTLGMDVDPDEALRLFDGRVVAIDNGEKWWIRSFIEYQYGKLNPKNLAHSSAIKRLELFGLMDSVQFVDGENVSQNLKGLARGLQAPKDKDKDKDKEGGVGETRSPYPERSLVQEQIRAANAASPQAVADMRNQFLADSNQQLLLHKLLAARGGHNERLSREALDTWMDVFITTLETDGKPLPSNYGDFSNHFRNWMKFNYRTTVSRFQAKEEPLEPHVARYLARKNNGQA
jgi:hypothetical protein